MANDGLMAATTETRSGGLKRGSWQTKFIAAFRDTGLVIEAAKVAGKSRATVYRERDRNPAFAESWTEADEWVTEELEQEAKRRALGGSDTLLMFLLKSKRPSVYRDNLKVTHGGAITHEVEESVDAAINSLLTEVDRLRGRLAEVEPDGQAAAARGAQS